MHRFFVPSQKIQSPTITIDDPRELHHICDVLRLRAGDQLICFDGKEMEYLGTITQKTNARLIIKIDRQIPKAQGRLTLWLAQGLPKADRFDWVVQKATELGVTRLSPVITRHTIVRPTVEQGRKKCVRWQRIAQEAAKQCGRTTVPSIDLPQSFETFLPLVERVSLILMPTLVVTAIPLGELLKAQANVKDVAILIGPEGDFNREEAALAQAYGARPVSLGSLTLRSETAALATVAIVQHVLGQG